MYSAFHQLPGHQPFTMPPDRIERALQVLYAYHQTFKKERKHGRTKEPNKRTAEQVIIWLERRMKTWSRQGRINRHGMLIGRPYVHAIPLPRLRRAFPTLSRTELLVLRRQRMEVSLYAGTQWAQTAEVYR